MTKLDKKKRPTEVTALAALNFSIGVLYLVVGFYYDTIFHTGQSLAVPEIDGDILVFTGILFFVLAYVLWNGKWWVDVLLGIWVVNSLLALGPFLEVVGAKAFNPPFVYYFQAELFGLVYILLIGVFVYMKPNVKAFFARA